MIRKKRGRPKIKRPVGRPRKKIPLLAPKETKKQRIVLARDKSAKIKKKMEKFLLDMFGLYEDKEGKESIRGALLKDNKFSEAFVKEFFGLVRKYFDMKIAEMKIFENNAGDDEGGKYKGPQNVFIIAGLHDQKIGRAVQDAIEGKPVKEAEFTVVGL